MKQNKYDEAEFFNNYSKMARSVQGLDAAGEWHELRTLLPDLKDKRVLDLGCWFWVALPVCARAASEFSDRCRSV